MALANVLNVVLDPLLIFGLWGFPELGILGAAVATVIGRGAAMVASLAALRLRHRMLVLPRLRARELWSSWREVLCGGIPAATAILLGHVALGVVTRIASRFGRAAVAALGAGVRIEMIAMMVVIALASVMVPFAGQNSGAGQFGRVRKAQRFAERFAVVWGVLCLAGFFAAAGPIARLFSDKPDVVENIVLFLRIVPIGYGLAGVAILTGADMNGINRPLHSALLGAVRMLALQIPLAALGAQLWGLTGVFLGIALANVLAGIAALFWIRRLHHAAAPNAA